MGRIVEDFSIFWHVGRVGFPANFVLPAWRLDTGMFSCDGSDPAKAQEKYA